MKKPIQTILSAAIPSNSLDGINALIPFAHDLNLDTYYFTNLTLGSGTPVYTTDQNLAAMKSFADGAGSKIDLLYKLYPADVTKIEAGQTMDFTILDHQIAVLGAKRICIEQESQGEVVDATYVKAANQIIAHLTGKHAITVDCSLVYKGDPQGHHAAAVKTIIANPKPDGRGYLQLQPDILTAVTNGAMTSFDPDDFPKNLAVIKGIIATNLPAYLTLFATRYPNCNQQDIEQFHLEDLQVKEGQDASVGKVITGTVLGNWAMAEIFREVFENTDRYSRLTWMQFTNLFHRYHGDFVPNPEYYTIKRLSPLSKFKYCQPIALGTGLSGLLFTNPDNTAAALINNSTGFDVHIPKATIAANITSTISNNIGYGNALNAEPTNIIETSATEVLARKFSSGVSTFSLKKNTSG